MATSVIIKAKCQSSTDWVECPTYDMYVTDNDGDTTYSDWTLDDSQEVATVFEGGYEEALAFLEEHEAELDFQSGQIVLGYTILSLEAV